MQQKTEIGTNCQTPGTSCSPSASEITKHKPTLYDAQNILSMLQTDSVANRRDVWSSKTSADMLESIGMLQSLRDIDLKIIVRYFKRTLGLKIKESVPKQSKVNELLTCLDIKQTSIPEKESAEPKVRKRSFKIKSLEELAADVLNKSVTKHQMNVAMAGYLWPDKYQNWIDEGPLSCKPKINNTEYPEFWFYQPDFSNVRQQLEVRCIDSSHLLTRTRRKSCKGGLDGVSNEPWLKVAKSKKTFLSPIMVQEITEPMSVMMASTHFSEQVETEMRNNGDVIAADLCRDIRHWWLSEDEPGISAGERVRMRINLRDRLLSHVKFDQFPPPTVHIRGWPLQLWEALIANMDAKALLYALCHSGTYNVRAFSSMMGETFFSELTLADKRGHGTVTSEEFGQFIGTSIEQLQLRLDPERKFAYRTSRSKVYKLVDDTDQEIYKDGSNNEDTPCPVCNNENSSTIRAIHTRDHWFDTQNRKRLKGKRKEIEMSQTRNAVEHGSLGVRWDKGRRNDSKSLPTSRMGLDDKRILDIVAVQDYKH